MARSLPVENLYYHGMWSQLSTILAVMLLKQPNGEIPVVVDYSQLTTLASETVDPIDWPLSPTLHRAIPPELHVLHAIMKMMATNYKTCCSHWDANTRPSDARQRTAHAATQGIDITNNKLNYNFNEEEQHYSYDQSNRKILEMS